MVNPTNSGRMVELRDHVLMGRLLLPAMAASTLLSRDASTNGPFLIERAIVLALYLRLRRETIIELVRLLRRVRYPLAGVPHGRTGSSPSPVRPSPPPWGRIMGLMATTSTPGRLPRERVTP